MSIQSSSSTPFFSPLTPPLQPESTELTSDAAPIALPDVLSQQSHVYGDLCLVLDEENESLNPPFLKKARTLGADVNPISDEESALIRSIEKQSSSPPIRLLPPAPIKLTVQPPLVPPPSPPQAESVSTATTIPGLTVVTPAKNYPIQICDDGKIRIIFTPNGKKFLKSSDSVVYRFKRTSTEQRYIGATQNPQGRVYSHQSAMNNPQKALTKLSQAISDNPEEFVFGIILQLPSGSDAREEETALIRHHKATDQTHGYNTRNGGGGGVAQRKTSDQDKRAVDPKKLLQKVSQGYASPESIPLMKGKKIKVTLAPEDRQTKCVIYDILYDPTQNKADRIHHIGYTTTTVGQRMSSHLSIVNNPQGKAAQRAGDKLTELYEAIRKDPDHYSIRIYDVKSLVEEGAELPALETAYMKFFQDERGEKVQNYGCGGRGSVAQNL